MSFKWEASGSRSERCFWLCLRLPKTYQTRSTEARETWSWQGQFVSFVQVRHTGANACTSSFANWKTRQAMSGRERKMTGKQSKLNQLSSGLQLSNNRACLEISSATHLCQTVHHCTDRMKNRREERAGKPSPT